MCCDLAVSLQREADLTLSPFFIRPNGPSSTSPPPPFFSHDYLAIRVGTGRPSYDAAVAAVTSWRHADGVAWVVTNAPAARVGARLVIAASVLGPATPPPLLPLFLWLANPLRVTEVRRGARGVPAALAGARNRVTRPPPRGDTARGTSTTITSTTLTPHVLAGTETFGVHWVAGDDSVWFSVEAVSRPASAAAVVAWPLVRTLQAAFRGAAAHVVGREVQEAKGGGRRRGLVF